MTNINPFPPPADDDGVMDFSDPNARKLRTFRIDDDIFSCARAIPASTGRLLASLVDKPPMEQFDGLGKVLDMIMLPESAQVFAHRMQDPTNPISLNQLNRVIEWLLSEYGGRPTSPAASSQPQLLPDDTGTSSTDGPRLEVLTP